MTYPGDTADPVDVAGFFAEVAQSYKLPRILPIMTSAVEMTSAWTGPGDVKDIPGYLEPVDGCSVGYFQQQADNIGCGVFGWGTKAQCQDATYAVNRFCQEAVKYIDDEWNSETTDPAMLGEWAATVQRPLESLRYMYAFKGYPIAQELLADWDSKQGGATVGDVDGWPTAHVYLSNGWLYTKDPQGNVLWLHYDPNLELKTNKDGWLFLEQENVANQETSDWEWPVGTTPPDPSSWYYEERHPIRWTWRADVEAWARYLVNNYDVSCNTYYDHPEGYWRTEDSIDVWGPGGRDDPIDYATGQAVFEEVMGDPGKPDIDWIIWQRTIYGAWNGWNGEPFGDGSTFTNHEDHVHITYK